MTRLIATVFSLVLVAGCASFSLPTAMTQGGITEKRKQRQAEVTKHIDHERDTADLQHAEAQLTQEGDAAGCQKTLEKLLSRNPKHRDARLLAADVCLSDGDAPAAYRHAKIALELYPNDGDVQYMMAIVLDAQGKSSEALSYYERAARRAPDNRDYAEAYETARDAVGQEMRASRIATLADADGFSDAKPASFPAPNPSRRVGQARRASAGPASHSNDSSSAGSNGISPDDPAASLLEQGRSALAGDSPRSAMEHFRRAIATNPDNPQIPISAAAMALRSEHPELAVELLKPAATRFSKSPAVERMLGVAYYRIGDYKSSQVALRQAVSLDNSSALSYLLLGHTLAKLGQHEAAEANLRQAAALDPKYVR